MEAEKYPIDSCSQIEAENMWRPIDAGGHDELMSSDTTQVGDAEAAEATSNPNVNQRKRGLSSISAHRPSLLGEEENLRSETLFEGINI